MAGETRRSVPGQSRELARLRRRLAELEEAQARTQKLVEELRHGGDLFRSIADKATDGILVMDDRGMVYYLNQAAERLFGYQSRELEGLLLHDVLVPEERRGNTLAHFEEQATRGMEGILGRVWEFGARRKDGSVFPVEVSISSFTIEERSHYIAICRDITPRKRAEEELKESRRLYQDLVENLNEVLFNLDNMGRISYISPTVSSLSSYRPEEVIGQPFTRFVHPDDLPGLLEAYRRTLAGELSPSEFRVLDKDGREVHVRTSSRPLYRNGELAGLTGLLADVTQRKQAEEELERYRGQLEELVRERTLELQEKSAQLERSERYFRALIENAYDLIAVLDAEGRIRYLSPSMEKMTGRAAGEFLQADAFGFVHPADLPRVMEAFSRVLREPAASEVVEYRWRRQDGTWHWHQAVATNLLHDTAVGGVVVNARDITDRRKAEEALRDSEELYRSVVEASPDCIIMVDLEGTILMVNRSGLRLFRCEDESQMVGRNFVEFMDPEELPRARQPMLERVDMLDEPIEFTSVRADGTRFISESNSRLIRNAQGIPVGFLSVTRDVTERRRAERALRESEERYRTLVETSPDGIVVTDLQGKVVMLNRSCLALLGYERAEEVLGRSVLDFMAPEEKDRAWGLMRSRMEAGRAMTTEFTLLRKDGSSYLGEITAALVRDAEGAPWGFIGITRDVTERRRAEERLERLNRCFLSLGADPLENIQKLAMTGKEILAVDLVRYGRMEKEAIFYFSSDRAEEGFVPLEDVEGYVCQHLLSSGASGPVSSRDLEEGVFERDPVVRSLGMRSGLMHPVYVQGRGTGCLCAFSREDRSYSAVEMDLLAMLGRAVGIEEERRAFNESLRDFVDIASHELRHPVALLAGFAETLDAHWSDMDEPTRREAVDAIKQTADRLNRLAMGLLETSLVERERFTLRKQPADLGALLDSAVAEMKARYPHREFNLFVSEGVGRREVDPDRILDLMVILLDNAVKYSGKDTEIDVSAEVAKGVVTVAVADRGVGVPDEHRERIFKRFHQVDKAQYHSKPGLGLGLFLARQIVEAHGGAIWHEDREGGGSVFRFTLP